MWILDWCFMCKRNGESVDHLFLHCPFAMDLWSMVLGLFGVSWVMPRTVLGLLGCWQGNFGRHWIGYIWSIIPHCLMWCLWWERNCRCFEDYENSIPDLKLFFFKIGKILSLFILGGGSNAWLLQIYQFFFMMQNLTKARPFGQLLQIYQYITY